MEPLTGVMRDEREYRVVFWHSELPAADRATRNLWAASPDEAGQRVKDSIAPYVGDVRIESVSLAGG